MGKPKKGGVQMGKLKKGGGVQMGKLKKGGGGGGGEAKAGKRKRPGLGNSLAWKNVTPEDPLSVLVGSDEGGFMSLEEIDGDVFVGGVEDGGSLVGAIPEGSGEAKKPKDKKRKKTGKDGIPEVSVEAKKPKEEKKKKIGNDGIPEVSLEAKKPKEKKKKIGKDVVKAKAVNASNQQDSPVVGVTQSKKSAKGKSKPLFVVGPVISTVAADVEGGVTKDAKEEVSDVEALKSKESTPSKKSTPQKKGGSKEVKEVAVPDVGALKPKDGLQKKVKLGSKARRLLKLQKQQGQKGVDKIQIHTVGKEISEEDLRKREDMELERLENLPSSEDVEVEEIDMSAWARLRLHPILMKALMKLKFSKPTAIQEACISAAAYQGKDVIGAAETGSGKTLAFGLPILQRLLDDQAKNHKKSEFDKATKKQSGGPLRALIITPTRELALQVCDHIRAVAQFTNATVVPIVGGMALQKQQRLLGYHPQIVVGTPGRLWELMSAGESHLLDLSQLSFFVLDEADRMVERGHFKELQTIMDMLPKTEREQAAEDEKPPQRRKRRREYPKEDADGEEEEDEQEDGNVEVYPDSDDDDNAEEAEDDEQEADEEQEVEDDEQEADEEVEADEQEEDEDQQIVAEDVSMEEDFPGSINNEPVKKRQTLVFSATLALPPGFKKKLKRGFFDDKSVSKKNEYSVASLIQKAAMRSNAAIVDLTTKDILAKKLEESVIECRDEEKDAYLYYILKVHGCGRTLVFCTSIAALRRVTAILRLLQVSVWPLHAQMQQKQRLKAMDRFKAAEDCVMVATDVAARGLDVSGIRTVIHYQLPHSAEMYVHRSGRTARADTDGISIAIISPSDRAKYTTLCRALDKTNGLQSFPIDVTYVPAILKRISLAFQVDKVLRKHQQNKVKQSWTKRNAEALELELEESDDDEETSVKMPIEKRELMKVQSLQQELQELLKQPLEPKAFSRRYITGSGITPVLARQLKEYTTPKLTPKSNKKGGNAPIGPVNNIPAKGKLLVIGQEAVEPLDALRRSTLLNTSSKPIPASTPTIPKSQKDSGAPKSKRRRR
ncbi:hypothetical protein M758_2G013800 [Ceratodon purpureus]|nr:hypothetical protein M758_2G013800 [Ceratodon purpureus]